MFEKQQNLNLQQRGYLDHDKIILCVANIRYIHHAWCVLFALKIFMRAIFSNKTSIRAWIQGPAKLAKSLAELNFAIYMNYCIRKYIIIV